MAKKTGIIIVVALGVVILALLLVLIFVPAKKAVAPAPSDWSTYKNETYNFSIQYPAGPEVREGDPLGIYLEPETSNATTVVSFIFPLVDTFSENGSHGYYQYQVRVTATPLAQYACAIGADTKPAITSDVGAAAGNRVAYTRYGFCHGGRLYGVYDIFASGSDGTPLTPKLESDIAAGKIRNEEITKNFKFLE